MSRLNTRLAKLEAANPRREKLDLIFALLECPLPSGDPREWARRILLDFGDYPGGIVVDVTGAPERRVLLPPTSYDAVAFYSPEERIIQAHHYIHPRFEIIGTPDWLMVIQEDSAGRKIEWLSEAVTGGVE